MSMVSGGSGTGSGTQGSGALTVGQAAQFNYLAYQITAVNNNGQPVYAPGTPSSAQTLPPGWQAVEVHTDPTTGQTDVLFVNSSTQQIYIAAQGTSNLSDVTGPDLQILVLQTNLWVRDGTR